MRKQIAWKRTHPKLPFTELRNMCVLLLDSTCLVAASSLTIKIMFQTSRLRCCLHRRKCLSLLNTLDWEQASSLALKPQSWKKNAGAGEQDA